MTPGLVSIIVASYNHAGYLERRMESLLGQTYQNIEVLVIDDCSTDNSLDVLRKYESCSGVQLVARNENGGWVVVFNQGTEMSAGEFILFANCDDECDPTMVERLVEGMRANPSAGICYCRSLLIDEEGHPLGDDFSGRERTFRARCATDVLLDKNEMQRFLLDSCVIPNTSAALIRRACFNSVGRISSEYRICSDWLLYFDIVRHYDVAYIAAPLNKFRQHKSSITGGAKSRIMYEEILRLLLGQIKTLGLSSTEKARYRMHVMYLWAIHLLSPTTGGMLNFNFHLKIALAYDWVALTFLPIAMVGRFVSLLYKFPVRSLKKIVAG